MATDTFSSDSSPLAAPWASVGSFNQLKALAGVAQIITASSDSSNRYSTSSETLSRVTIGSVGDGDGGPAILDSSANGYTAILNLGGQLGLGKFTAGSFGNLGSAAYTPAPGDVVEVDVSHATNVVVKVNSSALITVADSAFRAGLNPAIFIFGTPTFTDWTDGASAGAGGPLVGGNLVNGLLVGSLAR